MDEQYNKPFPLQVTVVGFNRVKKCDFLSEAYDAYFNSSHITGGVFDWVTKNNFSITCSWTIKFNYWLTKYSKYRFISLFDNYNNTCNLFFRSSMSCIRDGTFEEGIVLDYITEMTTAYTVHLVNCQIFHIILVSMTYLSAVSVRMADTILVTDAAFTGHCYAREGILVEIIKMNCVTE